MTSSEIATPFVLFLEDGVNIFDSVVKTERWLEPQGVLPDEVGYDSMGNSLCVEVVKDHPWSGNRVRIRIDPTRMDFLLASSNIRDHLVEYFLRENPGSSEEHWAVLSTADLLGRLFK